MSIIKKLIAIGTALTLTLSAFPVSASAAAYSYSSVVSVSGQSTTTIARGTDLTVSSGTMVSGGLMQERIITHTPGDGSAAVVAYGNKLRGMTSPIYVANWLEQNGYDPVAGVNADYFMMDTGISIGMVVTDGILRTSDTGWPALGILPDGSGIIGSPSLDLKITTSAGITVSHPYRYINKTIKNYGVYLITPDYSGNTYTNTNTLYIRMAGAQDALRIGGKISATVTEVFYSDKPVDLVDGEMYLAATVDNGNDSYLKGINVGDTVNIEITSPDPIWSTVEYAVGGKEMLVVDGAVQSGFEKDIEPRTAVGVRADGSLILYTVDGRQSSWSAGMSLNDLAIRMRELGCVTAMNLDGGGSTAMVAQYPGYESVSTVTRPSGGSLRGCANYIFIVNTAPKTNVPAHFGFYGGEYSALSGSDVSFELKAWDENYHAVALPSGINWSVSGSDSTITQNGVFTAGLQEGSATVTAYYGGVSASTVVKVIGSPDEIRLYSKESDSRIGDTLVLGPANSLDLRAECIVKGEVIKVAENVIKWSFSGDAATVNDKGLVTASNVPGRVGTLTVSVGAKSVQVRVSVGDVDKALEDFESNQAMIEAGNNAIHAAIQSNTAYVARGKASGRITYNFSDEAAEEKTELTLRMSYDLADGANFLRMWVYGDGSGNSLTFSGTLTSGGGFSLAAIPLDFTGYKQVTLSVPSGAAKLTSLKISLLSEDRPTGTVYLDQLVASRTESAQDKLPVLENIVLDTESTPGSAMLTAMLSDGGEPIDPGKIEVTLDGEPVGFFYGSAERVLTVIITNPGNDKLHRLTIVASDADGNLVRRSVEFGSDTSSVFSGTAGYWYAPYANYLYNRGALEQNYTKNKNGDLLLRPGDALTRTEFAVMMTHYMGIDTSRYGSVELPYSDMAKIPEYARGAVVAMYIEGIITGKVTSDGVLFFDPNATITRSELMTIIGRTLPKGYSEGGLNFKDADSILEYAKEYISMLVGVGIVEGYEDGSIRPNNAVTRAEGIKLLYEMY